MSVIVTCKKRNPMKFTWSYETESFTHKSIKGTEYRFMPWSQYKSPWIGKLVNAVDGTRALITVERELGALEARFGCGSVIQFNLHL